MTCSPRRAVTPPSHRVALSSFTTLTRFSTVFTIAPCWTTWKKTKHTSMFYWEYLKPWTLVVWLVSETQKLSGHIGENNSITLQIWTSFHNKFFQVENGAKGNLCAKILLWQSGVFMSENSTKVDTAEFSTGNSHSTVPLHVSVSEVGFFWVPSYSI